MRSRLAIASILAAGVVMSGGGAAFGVSALSTDLTASSAQYGGPGPSASAGAGGAGGAANPSDSAGTGGGGSDAPGQSPSGVLGARSDGGTAAKKPASAVAGAGAKPATAVAQASRQVAASTAKSLPFTGYLAIPMLLLGLGMLASGLVLRRRMRGDLHQ